MNPGIVRQERGRVAGDDLDVTIRESIRRAGWARRRPGLDQGADFRRLHPVTVLHLGRVLAVERSGADRLGLATTTGFDELPELVGLDEPLAK